MTPAFFDLLIFDCDGVLVDSEVLACRVLADALGDAGYAIGADACRDRFTGRSLSSVVAEVEAEWGGALPGDFLTDLRRRDAEAFERELEAIPGVRPSVEALGRRACVASSGGMLKIRHSLTVTGLIDLFEPHLFSAEQVDRGKPAPDLFLHAAAAMAVEPARAVVVEDSPTGVAAGVAAGMTVIGFLGGSHVTRGWAAALTTAGARHCIRRMADLPEALARLRRPA